MKTILILSGRDRLLPRTIRIHAPSLSTKSLEHVWQEMNGLMFFLRGVDFPLSSYWCRKKYQSETRLSQIKNRHQELLMEDPLRAEFLGKELSFYEETTNPKLPSHEFFISTSVNLRDFSGTLSERIFRASLILDEREKRINEWLERLDLKGDKITFESLPLKALADNRRSASDSKISQKIVHPDRITLADKILRGYKTVMPRELPILWLHRLFSVPFPAEIQCGLHMIPYSHVGGVLRKSLDDITKEKGDSVFKAKVDEDARKAYDEALDAFDKGEKFFAVRLCFLVAAKNEGELEKSETILQDSLGSIGVKLVLAKWQQLDIMRYTFPTGVME